MQSYDPCRRIRMSRSFSPDNDATVVTGNCLDHLRALPNGTADLLITSPPYNIGKSYEDKLDLAQYTAYLRSIIRESARIISDGGNMCWQVGNTFDSGSRLVLIDRIIDEIVEELRDSFDLRLQNRIIWHFEHGLHATRRFSGRYETILWYSKGRHHTFNLDPVRIPQKYPGKRSYKGPNLGRFSGHPLGKNPADFWTSDIDVWNIPNVKSRHVEKLNHPCQFPMDLVARLILSLSNPGAIVVDPFGGVGTTAATAILLGRRALSIDTHADYSRIARQRIKLAWNRELRFRSSLAPIQPDKESGVAKLPETFANARNTMVLSTRER